MHPSWIEPLAPAAPRLAELGQFLDQEDAAGRDWLPPAEQILSAFSQPFEQVKVLIVGQDPYPTPGHGMGLAFSVAPEVNPLPKSLINIFQELSTDLACPVPTNGDLSMWADQGVMLLNRVLTVGANEAGSHQGRGWELVTETAIAALAARDQPLVTILWGNQAQRVEPLLGDTAVIASAHPSPLAAYRGFFGSKPFSRANDLLKQQGATPINWS